MTQNNKVSVKVLSDTALAHCIKNVELITKKIQENDDNQWTKEEFEQPMFVEKKFSFEYF